MLLLLCVVVVASTIAWFVLKHMNKPLADKISTTAKKVETETKNVVVSVADVNNDGKVNVKDVKAAGKKVKETATKVVKKTRKKKDA